MPVSKKRQLLGVSSGVPLRRGRYRKDPVVIGPEDAIDLTGERTPPAKNSGGKGQQSPNVSDSFLIK